MIRSVFVILLILIFLAAAGYTVLAFYAADKGHSGVAEIEGLISALIATVCVAAGFIGCDDTEAQLAASRQNSANVEPTQRLQA